VGADAKAIIENTHLLLTDKNMYHQMAQAHNPYGDGRACERVVKFVTSN
jgi:UDP-N-acetylglucosamine 2-epimerase (non-hydrolysing)